VDLEQITASGTVIVGGAGTGALQLLGVASSVSDGGADIGQFAGGRGSVTVNGGEWMNGGLLTVGDAGTGSLLINGTSGGTTGQVTAFNATIGNQAGGQGSVALNAGEFLVANVAAASSTLAVGGGGTGELAVEGGSEVAVGVAQGTIANNNGQLVVGGSAGGQGRVRIGGNSSLLVYGNAAVGAAGASARASAAYANSASANGPATGTVTVGESADDIALFSLLGTLSVTGAGQVALGGSHATVRASAVNIAQGGAISGAGTLSGLGGGNRTVTLASIDNEGSILASGGNLLLYGAVRGMGTLLIDANSKMTLQAAVGSSQTLAFGHNATAVLNDARAFAGTISGFGSDDLLELANTQATSATWADGILTINAAFGPIRLNVAGSYASNFFSVQSDGLGGTYVAGGHGDVHMVCFDGLAYDFQAVGDFVAVQSSDAGNPWQVQIRTESFPGATSITTELAAMIGDVRISFAVGRDTLVHVDGAPDAGLQAGGVQSFAGGALAQLSANVYQLSWSTGRSVTITEQDGYLDWAVGLGAQDGPGSVKGLLGSNSGRATDFQLPDGTVLHQPSDAEILDIFADAWRVKPDSSLLDDPHGPNPATLVQAMAAELVPHGAATYDPGLPHQDANAQANLLAPSLLHA
jgi:T5SS/PEP-CTERM-associated repeat protein